MKVTNQDIAELTGLHRNTVSAALKEDYQGNPETRERVLKAREQLLGQSEGKASPAKQSSPVGDSELPEGARLVKPVEKMTRNHEWTLEFTVKWPCDFEYDNDENGKPIPETGKCVEWEDRQKEYCFDHRPTKREVDLLINDWKAKAKAAERT